MGWGSECQAHDPPRDVRLPTEERLNPEQFQEKFLPQVQRAIEGRQLLLLIDETERLLETGKEVSGTIFGNLRKLMQEKEWISCVFAGTHDLQEGEWAAHFNEMHPYPLDLLSEGDQKWLIHQPIINLIQDSIYDDPAADLIAEWAGQYPMFIHLICHVCVNHYNEVNRPVLTREDLEFLRGKLLEQGFGDLNTFFVRSRARERILLCLLAHGHLNKRAVHDDNLPALLAQWGYRAARDEIREAMERLQKRKLVSAHQKGYTHQIGLFREWLIENKLDAFKGGDFQWTARDERQRQLMRASTPTIRGRPLLWMPAITAGARRNSATSSTPCGSGAVCTCTGSSTSGSRGCCTW